MTFELKLIDQSQFMEAFALVGHVNRDKWRDHEPNTIILISLTWRYSQCEAELQYYAVPAPLLGHFARDFAPLNKFIVKELE